MLQPIRATDVRLNSTASKKVHFSKEGKSHSLHSAKTTAIAMSRRQAKRQVSKPPRMPSPPNQAVIGSSCTWGEFELECFHVTVQWDVDPLEIIPERFFVFDHLEEFQNCITLGYHG